jgi:Fe-S-cluster containining protein
MRLRQKRTGTEFLNQEALDYPGMVDDHRRCGSVWGVIDSATQSGRRELDTPVIKGRSCGVCSLCCKLLEVSEISKPEGKWCVHCAPGRERCTIHDRRPDQCRSFYCGWLTMGNLGDDWRPTKAKMVLSPGADGKLITVHVDPAFPNAWKEDPYHGMLRKLARDAADAKGQVVVYLKKRAIVILPDKDVELGELAPGDHITVDVRETSSGRVFEAHRIPADELLPPSNKDNRSKVAGRSDLIGRAMAIDARRAAVFHDLERALNQFRAPE